VAKGKRKRKQERKGQAKPKGLTCAACAEAIEAKAEAEAAACSACEADYHPTCWQERKRCATCEAAGPAAERTWLDALRLEFSLPGSAIALLAVLITIAYVNAYQVPFLFDDAPVITRNRLLWQWETIDQLILLLPTRALTNLTFLINFQLAGTPTVQNYGFWDTFSYHLVSIALHVFNAGLLYLLIRKLLESRPEVSTRAIPWVALGGAGLWAVHPAHTMAVSYIAQRYALMAALAFLGTLVLYVTFRRYTTRHEVALGELSWRLGSVLAAAGFLAGVFVLAGAIKGALVAIAVVGGLGVCVHMLLLHEKPHTARAFLLLIATLATSLCCAVTKENAAVIPLAVLLVELFFFRGPLLGRLSQGAILFLPFVAGAGIRVAQVGWDRLIPANSPTATQGQYAVAQIYVTLRYLHNFFWPTDLTVEKNFATTWDSQVADTILAGTRHALIWALAVLLLLRGHRLIPFAIGWYYVTNLVESSIVPILDLMVDHRMYLTTAMIPAAFAVALARAWPQLEAARLRRVVLAVWIGLVLASMGGTYLRNTVWASSTAIWEDTIEKRPDCARAYSSLGMEHLYKGEWLQAVGPIETAVDLGPYHVEGWNNLGKAYLELGEIGYPRAIEALKQGIVVNRIAPSNSVPLCWNNLGLIYQRMALKESRPLEERIKHLHESVRHLRQATVIDNDYEVAYVNLGGTEFRLMAMQIKDDTLSKKHAANVIEAVAQAQRVATRRGGRLPFSSHRVNTAALSHLGRFGEAFQALLKSIPYLMGGGPNELRELAGMVELAGRVALEAQIAQDANATKLMTDAAALYDQSLPPQVKKAPSLLLLRGELAEKLGDAPTAKALYLQVLEAQPDHPQAAKIKQRLAGLK
jgi:tetratricopeptide (TPR) repeat protein